MRHAKNRASASEHKKRVEHELEGGTAGALAGATVGAVAGPPGAMVGAVVGGMIGAVTGLAVEESNEAHVAENLALDEAIGVTSGDLGAPNLAHPAATRGLYSGASLGTAAASDDESPAEGPFQAPRS